MRNPILERFTNPQKGYPIETIDAHINEYVPDEGWEIIFDEEDEIQQEKESIVAELISTKEDSGSWKIVIDEEDGLPWEVFEEE